MEELTKNDFLVNEGETEEGEDLEAKEEDKDEDEEITDIYDE